MTSNEHIAIGTLFACTWGCTMRLPYFAKVIAKNGKQSVTVIELETNDIYEDKVYKQGNYQSFPTEKTTGKAHTVRLKEDYKGVCILGKCDHIAHIWNGSALLCNDLD